MQKQTKILILHYVLMFIGFILPASRLVIMKLPLLFTALFQYVLSFAFPTKITLTPLMSLGVSIGLILLGMYIYYLIRMSVDVTKQTKRSYMRVVLLYCAYSIGFLLIAKETQGDMLLGLSYYGLLAVSTYTLKHLTPR